MPVVSGDMTDRGGVCGTRPLVALHASMLSIVLICLCLCGATDALPVQPAPSAWGILMEQCVTSLGTFHLVNMAPRILGRRSKERGIVFTVALNPATFLSRRQLIMRHLKIIHLQFRSENSWPLMTAAPTLNKDILLCQSVICDW